jgi:hypothetical protein
MGIPGCQPFLPLVAAATSAFFAGVTSGSWSIALKAGVVALATAYAFQGIGDITSGMPGAIPIAGMHGTFEPFSAAHIANILGHALVGCGAAVASGQKCGPGALSGAIGSLAGPFLRGLDIQARLIITATMGGLASVAGGGNFANGAMTAAFGYLFNEVSIPRQSRGL